MSNQLKQTLVAGAAVPVPGADNSASAAQQPQTFAEGSAVQELAEEFDSLTAAMLPESLDEAESDWSQPDMTGLDGNIVLCDLSGGGEEAVDEAPAAAAAKASGPVTMGVPKFDEEPELELDIACDSPAPERPVTATAVGRPAPPLPAPADLAGRASASRGAAVPPPTPAARPAGKGRSPNAALAATVPAGAPRAAATPPPVPQRESASFSTEFSRGGASVHTFPIVRVGFILAGLMAACAVAWYFVLAP